MHIARQILLDNDYPQKFVDAQLHTRLATTQQIATEDQTDYSNAVVIPYKQGFSNVIKRNLSKFGLKTTFKPYNQMSSFFTRLKDQEEVLKKSCCVYRLNCGKCGSKYVGNTLQRVEERLYQHRYAIRRGELEKSAVALHVHENDSHYIEWDKVEILAKEPDRKKRFF